VNFAGVSSCTCIPFSSVIDTNRPEHLTSVHRRYCEIFNRTAKERDLSVEPCVILTLKEKILQNFGDRVKLEKLSKKHGLVLFSSSMLKDTALQTAAQCITSEEFTVLEY